MGATETRRKVTRVPKTTPAPYSPAPQPAPVVEPAKQPVPVP